MKKSMTLVAVTAIMAISQIAVVTSASADAAQRACYSDYKKFCSDVERGGGRVKKCFMEHREELSPGCREAMDEKLAEQAKTTAPAATTTAPSTAPAAETSEK